MEEENELKGLKSELATLERKIQLELAKDKEPDQTVAIGTEQDKEPAIANTYHSGFKI